MPATVKQAKYLSHLTEEQFGRLTAGFNRFRFGFAEPGERLDNCEFVGNFAKRKDAHAAALGPGASARINPYLSGRLKQGWAVWKVLPATDLATAPSS